MPFEVIEIQSTPNPNAQKIVLRQIISDKPISFFNPEAGANHPLGSQLFKIPGICGLLILNDFITISKHPNIPWKNIIPAVKRVLKSYG